MLRIFNPLPQSASPTRQHLRIPLTTLWWNWVTLSKFYRRRNVASTAHHQQPTPERFFNTVNAFQQTEAMKAAIDLGIFTAIGKGNTTPDAIGARVKASERGIRILCDYLAIQGFLRKENGHYGLAPDAAVFLDRRSPAYLGGIVEFLTSDRHREAHRSIADAVRKGGSALPQTPFEPDDPSWVLFARVMMPLMRMPSEIIAAEMAKGGEVRKVLDIAAGHGIFGIAMARQNPEAQIYAADWPKVLEVARQNAEQAGVTSRYHIIPGSAFDVQFGSDYDLVLITNFPHHFDPPTCTNFLRKVHTALKRGGRAAILEFVPNPDRVTPPTAAAFSLIMLAFTPLGDAYTFRELECMAKDAGFSRVELSPTEVGVEQLVVAYK
jgi:SAM-dependent methyltransferase